MPAACDYTPKANALASNLRFQKIDLKGLPSAGGTARDSGYSYGMTEVKFIPGAPDEFIVLRKIGAAYHYKLDGEGANSATLVRQFTVPMVRPPSNGSDTGLLSLAFDPDFATNKFVYFGHAVGGGGRSSAITRFTYDNGITNPQRIIDFTTSSGGQLYHSIGSIGFDKDGYMWALHGDWNISMTPAQDLNSLLGKLIRIVPGRTPTAGGWEPAPGNPYMGMPKPQSAIYAYGFRSPWRGAVDSRGRYLVGDIGPNAGEEVNVVTRGGQNFGWNGNTTCGTGSIFCYRGGIAMLQGPGDSLRGRSVWVGPQYGNCGTDRYNGTLTGVYFHGDFFTGWVSGVLLNDDGTRQRYKQLGQLQSLSSWDQAKDGYLYITRFGSYSHEGLTSQEQGVYRVMLAQ